MEKKADSEKSKVIIEAKDVKKIYKVGSEKVLALNGVSFTINQGDFCCLLGTSGSRKIYSFKHNGWDRKSNITEK